MFPILYQEIFATAVAGRVREGRGNDASYVKRVTQIFILLAARIALLFDNTIYDNVLG